MHPLQGKRLVIFGCGYVGDALARFATGAGARVTALTRNPEKAEALASVVADTIVADLASTDWHGRIPGAPDFAVNCVSTGGGGLDAYRRSYVDGMNSILVWAAAGARPVGTFVYTSSTSVYPQGEGSVVDESAETSGASPGGTILREAEQCLEKSAAVGRSFVLRLAGIYGPGRHHLLDQLRAGATAVSGGRHRLNLAHRDDIVAAIVACLGAPPELAGGIFNVADGAPAPREEVLHWLAVRLGRPVPDFIPGEGGRRRGGEPVPDRIIGSAKLQSAVGWRPQFPDYRAGYESILGGA